MEFNEITQKETKTAEAAKNKIGEHLRGVLKKYVELIFVLLSYVLL
jgi:hypothetical protein